MAVATPAAPAGPSAEEAETARIILARRLFLRFVQFTNKKYVAEAVHALVAAKLQAFMEAVERGESPRLMVFVPPQHGKSELVSRRFPPWVLGHHPDWRIGIVSYGADLAEKMSRSARSVVQQPEYGALWPEHKLDPSSTSVSDWALDGHIGGVLALGVGGGITGNSLEILIVDDPVKGRDEVDGETYRQKQQDWWPQAHDRVQEGGGIIVLCTRWHHADLPGHLLQLAKDHPESEQWDVVSLPALAKSNDPLGRAVGEPLATSRWSLKRLLNERAIIPTRDWQAKFDQTPTADEGAIFFQRWLRFEDPPEQAPAGSVVFQSVDTSYGEEESDYSVVQTWRVEPTCYRLLHQYRERAGLPELKEAMLDLFARWKPVAVVVEDKASGRSVIQAIRAESRIPILPWLPDRNKKARAHAVTPVFRAGRVIFPKPDAEPWVPPLVLEMLQFPAAPYDDQVDGLTLALSLLIEPPQKPDGLDVLRFSDYRVDPDMALAAPAA